MPEEQNKKSSMLFSITVLIAAIIAGGIVTSFSPLESLRPSKSQKEVEWQVDAEKVLARLWQDPFQAVESAIKDANAKRKEFAIPSISSAVSDFYEDEFVPPLTIEILCNEISKKLFRVTVQAPINTIAWLNELLMVPDLYDTLLVKRPGDGFPKGIKDLVDRTEGYRNKDFHSLRTDEQRYIKRLNRLLLEEIYPNKSPKSLNPKIFTSQDKIQKVLILPVMVTAGPYADPAEERLRTRYALLSALHVAGYKPRNATHIGVFKAQIDQEVRRVPYECYIRDTLHIYKNLPEKPYDAVLVLWLGDEYFSKNRLEEMDSIKNDVGKLVVESLTTPPTASPTTSVLVDCKFLGPQYSSGLVDIYEQVSKCTGGTNKEKTKFAIYSPWANVDRDLIANYSNIQGTASAWNIDNFSKANISFTSTLHDYSQLTDVLVEELTRRGVNLSNDSDEHIVIISEWDAFYGRAVQRSFARSVQKYNLNYVKKDFNEPCSLERLCDKIVKDISASIDFREDELYDANNFGAVIIAKSLCFLNNTDRIPCVYWFKFRKTDLHSYKSACSEVSVSSITSEYSVKDINKILEDTELYLKVSYLKKPETTSSESVEYTDRKIIKDLNCLDIKTSWYRYKCFTELNGYEQCIIKWFNRLILADISKQEVPLCLTALAPLLNTLPNTVDWLNELLTIPGFYDIICKIRGKDFFSEKINNLVISTQAYRQKDFASLSKNVQEEIKKLNRYLLEEVYPKETLVHTACPARVHSIAYMSGIDGKLPNMELDTSAVNNAGSNQKNNSPTDFDKLIHKFEQPQGQDQYDYMRRLPDKVKNTARNPNKIRAIGVMGVDVYDKLLILRALRNEFPNALFFTTDLDARLWHHTELPFTRNLIVASSYGLQLHDMWQQDIPPFRSTYQTSVFVATLQALDVCKKDLSTIRPRIFEIGRRGAYDLSLDKKTNFHPDCPHQWNIELFARIPHLLGLFGLFILPCLFISGIFHCVFWNQNTYSKRYWIIYVFIGIVIFTAFIVVKTRDPTRCEFFNREIGSLIYLFIPPVLIISCLIWPFLPEQKDTENSLCFCFWKCFWKWFWIAWVVCFALFAAFAMVSSLSGDGEPITFFDGISVWPTELIRLFNGFLATYFFFLSCQHVKRNNKEITNMVSEQNGDGFHNDLRQTWNTFIKNNEPLNWKRCLIIGGITVVHLSIGFYFIYTAGKPLIPGRGSLCFVLDKTILICSLLLMYFLFWHVVFNTSKCRVLIKDLMINKDKLTDEYCHSFINIIAKKTEVEAKMIKYPFVLLLVLCVARYNFIDNWRWTAPLAVLTVLSILIVLCTAIMLFREANIARQKVVDQLNGGLGKLMKNKCYIYAPEDKGLERKIEFTKFIIEDIQNIKNGAFAPLGYNPILYAPLTSIGGVGIISLLQNMFH